HFQALSTALSATVGLGNIGGVALAVALGGPGAVFWMWMVGILGMAIKLTEVTLSMLYRNTDDPDNPHGGPMWVVSKGLAEYGPRAAKFGRLYGWFFCITLLTYTITGGAMFQAWNVGDITQEYFHVPSWIVGIILAVIVGTVTIGGIKRIGRVAGTLVPVMVVLYLLGGFYVLAVNFGEIPAMLKLIVVSAFTPDEASGAFVGGRVGYAVMIGMRRALLSSAAGAGSSPLAHSAAKTDEPEREGLVGGLERLIGVRRGRCRTGAAPGSSPSEHAAATADEPGREGTAGGVEPCVGPTAVCTPTALVIIASGLGERGGEATVEQGPAVVSVGPNV